MSNQRVRNVNTLENFLFQNFSFDVKKIIRSIVTPKKFKKFSPFTIQNVVKLLEKSQKWLQNHENYRNSCEKS